MALALAPGSPANAQTTAFTYQGRLNAGGAPANGIYDLQFAVYDAPASGNMVGAPVTNSAVAVSNGLFTAALDFGGGVFTGGSRWLDIAVRTNDNGAFTGLTPRQALTATPYALYAPGAGSAQSVVGIVSGNGLGLTNLNGASLQPGTLSTNALDLSQWAALLSALGGGGSPSISNLLWGAWTVVNTNTLWLTNFTTETNPVGSGTIALTGANGPYTYTNAGHIGAVVWTNGAYVSSNGFGVVYLDDTSVSGIDAWVLVNAAHEDIRNLDALGAPNGDPSTIVSSFWTDVNGAMLTNAASYFASNLTIFPADYRTLIDNGAGLTNVTASGGFADSAGAADFATNAIHLVNLPVPDFNAAGFPRPPQGVDSLRDINFDYRAMNNMEGYFTNAVNFITSLGLQKLGFTWMHQDDGWQGSVQNGVMVPLPWAYPHGLKYVTDYCHSNGCQFDCYLRSTDLASNGYADAITIVSNLVWSGCDGLLVDTSFAYNYPITYGALTPDRLQTLIRLVNAGASAAWTYLTNSRPRPFYVEMGLGIVTGDSVDNVFVLDAINGINGYELAWDHSVDLAGQTAAIRDCTFPYRDYLRPGHFGFGMVFDENEAHYPVLGSETNMADQFRQHMSLQAMVPSEMIYPTNTMREPWFLQVATNAEFWAYYNDAAMICGWQAWSNNLTEVWVRPLGSVSSGSNLVCLINYNTNAAGSNITVTAPMLNVTGSTVLQVRDPFGRVNMVTFTGSYTFTVPAQDVVCYAVYPASGPFAVNVSGSPWLWTNNLGLRVEAVVWGGTGVTLGVNGVQIGGPLSGTLAMPLLPGDWVGITNTSPPSFVWKAY